MIRICYIIGQLSKGGAERQLYELVRGLDKTRFLPVVISLRQGDYWAEELRKMNVRVIEIRRKKSREFRRLLRLTRLIKELKPDIVHTYLFAANTYGRIAAFIAKVPVVIASERNLPEIGRDKSRLTLYIDRMLAPFSDGIICNSLKAKDTLINNYSFEPRKIFTVCNGISMDYLASLSEQRVRNAGGKIIGTVGRLVPQKNHKLFLDVAKMVLDSQPAADLKFLIVGDGPLRGALENYAHDNGIGDKVEFAGERHDIPRMLKKMDIFLMTSLFEGMSNAIMEAMSAGLPVVASDVGGNRELITDSHTGFLCPSESASAFCDKVIHLLRNENEAELMGVNGKQRIICNFGSKMMVKETEGIYSALIKKGLKQLLGRPETDPGAKTV